MLGPESSRRELVLRLVVAEVISRPGDGPLAPRFASLLGRVARKPVDVPQEPA